MAMAKGTDPEPETKISVYVKVQSHVAVLIPEKKVSIARNSTARDAVLAALSGTGCSLLGDESYITGMQYPDGTRLTERAEGFPNSGWMYHVNGEAPSLMINQYFLNDGDRVLLYFVTDYIKSMDPVDLDKPVDPDTPEEIYYGISLLKSKHGKITSSADKAKAGEKVTLRAVPKKGYKLSCIKVNGKKISGKSFVMPKENVKVQAGYSLNRYTLKIRAGKGGKLTFAKTSGAKLKRKGTGGGISAGYGKTVTAAVRARKGYQFVKWTKSGKKVKTGKYIKISNRKSKGKVVKSVLTLKNVKKSASYKAVFVKK